VINEATYRHHFLGNGIDCTAEGPLDDRSLEKYFVKRDWASLTKGNGNDVGR